MLLLHFCQNLDNLVVILGCKVNLAVVMLVQSGKSVDGIIMMGFNVHKFS